MVTSSMNARDVWSEQMYDLEIWTGVLKTGARQTKLTDVSTACKYLQMVCGGGCGVRCPDYVRDSGVGGHVGCSAARARDFSNAPCKTIDEMNGVDMSPRWNDAMIFQSLDNVMIYVVLHPWKTSTDGVPPFSPLPQVPPSVY